jgi:hypothetical protein
LLKACRIVVTKWLPLLPLIIVFAACNNSNKPSFRVFASPEDASTALIEAANRETKTHYWQFSARNRKLSFFLAMPFRTRPRSTNSSWPMG